VIRSSSHWRTRGASAPERSSAAIRPRVLIAASTRGDQTSPQLIRMQCWYPAAPRRWEPGAMAMPAASARSYSSRAEMPPGSSTQTLRRRPGASRGPGGVTAPRRPRLRIVAATDFRSERDALVMAGRRELRERELLQRRRRDGLRKLEERDPLPAPAGNHPSHAPAGASVLEKLLQ